MDKDKDFLSADFPVFDNLEMRLFLGMKAYVNSRTERLAGLLFTVSSDTRFKNRLKDIHNSVEDRRAFGPNSTGKTLRKYPLPWKYSKTPIILEKSKKKNKYICILYTSLTRYICIDNISSKQIYQWLEIFAYVLSYVLISFIRLPETRCFHALEYQS